MTKFSPSNFPSQSWIGFLLSLSVFTGLLGLPLAQAHADTLDEVVKGALKAATDENHKVRVSINGDFSMQGSESGEKWLGNYQVISAGQVDNSCELGCKESEEMTLKLTLKPENAIPDPLSPPPFETLYVNAQINTLSYHQGEDLYVKLGDLNVSATGVPEDEKQEYESMVQDVKSVTAPYMNQWFYISQQDLQELSSSSQSAALMGEDFSKTMMDLIKNSDRQTGREFLNALLEKITAALEEGGEITADEKQTLLELAKTLMNSKIGYQYSLVSGYNVGFERWVFNRYLFSQALEEVTNPILNEAEKNDLLDFLKKMSFSFWYRLNPEGLMDVFAVYFQVEDLKGLNFNIRWRQTVWDQGKAYVPLVPEESKSLKELLEGTG